MAVSLIGNSIGTYSAPPPVYGVPGVSAQAPAASSLGGMSGALSSLYSSLSGPSNSNGASLSNLNTPATAAEIQQMQAGQSAPNATLGNLQTGVAAASMVNRAAGGASSTLGAGLGAAGGFLGIVNGVQQGGISGYGGAAVGALRAGSGIASLAGNSALAGTLGAAAGYVAAPLAVYNAISNWQSGSTGSDALNGAEAGAAVGSIIPGIGTVIGAVIGGAVGAISSAFGGGKTSPEATQDRSMNAALNNDTTAQRAAAISTMSPAQSIQSIQGDMNAHTNSGTNSEQIQQVFGKNGVSNLVGQMMPAINSAIQKNPSYAKMSPQQLYTQVVTPWLKSKGATISGNSTDVKGNTEGQNLIDSITNVIGQWQSGAFTSKTPVGVGGQTINIPVYAGG